VFFWWLYSIDLLSVVFLFYWPECEYVLILNEMSSCFSANSLCSLYCCEELVDASFIFANAAVICLKQRLAKVRYFRQREIIRCGYVA